jgi:periplasmic divalent cation tolerance protein
MKNYCLIQTTFKKIGEAKEVAKILLENKLIACAQISTIESLYSWNDKIIDEKEILLCVKTKTDFYERVEEVIVQNHSYDLPQITAVPILNGSKLYFDCVESLLIIPCKNLSKTFH